MSKKIRILLVDKSATFKDLLKSISSDSLLVAHCKGVKNALTQTATLTPDVVFLDIVLAGTQLSSTCAALRSAYGKVKIVLLSEKESEEELFASLAAGVDGYCLKQWNAKNFAKGLEAVTDGDFWLDSSIGKKVIRTVEGRFSRLKASEGKQKGEAKLSERELEVLILISSGLSNQQIAGKLKISAETVKTHISHLMKKLAVTDRTQAAVKAVRHGLI